MKKLKPDKINFNFSRACNLFYSWSRHIKALLGPKTSGPFRKAPLADPISSVKILAEEGQSLTLAGLSIIIIKQSTLKYHL